MIDERIFENEDEYEDDGRIPSDVASVLINQHQITGRKAKLVGDLFEEWIDVQHQKAKYLGIIAHVAHNQAQSRVIKGRLVFASPGVADYTGTLEGGLSLAEEAKSTSGKRLNRSAIEPKQAEHLDVVARAGGLALLLVEFRIEQAPRHLRYAVPWSKIPWVVKRTAQSVSANELEEWLIRPDECYLKKFHSGGRSSSVKKVRTYARE